METNFNFKSQVCTDKIQSERLLALGLKKETADCVWIEMSKDDWRIDANGWKAYYSIIEEGIIPAWSLDRLFQIYLDGNLSGYWNMITFEWDNLIDCIESRIERRLFNKKYLV